MVYTYPELFDEVRRAWAVWVLASQSFSSMLDGAWGYDITRDTTTRKIHNNKSEFSFYFSRRLEHVQLESTDALNIITSRDSPTSFFYIDPPYYNSDLGHYKGYTKEDFIRLLEVLSTLQGKFLLSSYPSDVLSHYTHTNGWHTEHFDQIVTVAIKNGKGKPKTEVLTSNYVARPPINLSLF
jgi:DNA adenine methylase